MKQFYIIFIVPFVVAVFNIDRLHSSSFFLSNDISSPSLKTVSAYSVSSIERQSEPVKKIPQELTVKRVEDNKEDRIEKIRPVNRNVNRNESIEKLKPVKLSINVWNKSSTLKGIDDILEDDNQYEKAKNIVEEDNQYEKVKNIVEDDNQYEKVKNIVAVDNIANENTRYEDLYKLYSQEKFSVKEALAMEEALTMEEIAENSDDIIDNTEPKIDFALTSQKVFYLPVIEKKSEEEKNISLIDNNEKDQVQDIIISTMKEENNNKVSDNPVVFNTSEDGIVTKVLDDKSSDYSNNIDVRKEFFSTYISSNKHISLLADNREKHYEDLDIADEYNQKSSVSKNVRENKVGSISQLAVKLHFQEDKTSLSMMNYQLIKDFAQMILLKPNQGIQIQMSTETVINDKIKKVTASRLAVIEEILNNEGISNRRIFPVLTPRDKHTMILKIIELKGKPSREQVDIFGSSTSNKVNSMQW
ncbi:MAG: hypothetical protein JJV93_01280 [Alphaproteobacteria bacterium]|nr:hypothetical protein [Alphaproteobacteria bacterium]MBL0717882.1 hypothetical protein [Alphaproteobacteria bacterium]